MARKKRKKLLSIVDGIGHVSIKELDKLGVEDDILPISIKRAKYVEDTVSSGNLCCDLITGGGWAPGRWITIFGKEASGKSTLVYQTIKQVIKSEIMSDFFDFEGSLDPPYITRILKIKSIDKIFGLRNEDNTWKVEPKCRYHQPDLGEPIFRYIHNVLKHLPDKVYHDDQWFLVFDKLPQSMKRKSYSKGLFKTTGKYWIPVEDGKIQMVWFIDSLPAMLPEAREEDSSKSPQAMLARMFSDYVPLIRGKLARKRCSIIAINQIRERPGSMYGNPEYEPCGNTVRHHSDIRVRISGISVPHGSGMIEEEVSWDKKGKDTYRYVSIRTTKNKTFVPFRQTIARIWVSHKGKAGFGFDPFWDTYQYLVETNQITGDRRGYYILVPGPWQNRRWQWAQLKELILNPNKKSVFKKFKLKYNKKENRDLRKACWSQIKSGEAFKLYFKQTGK